MPNIVRELAVLRKEFRDFSGFVPIQGSTDLIGVLRGQMSVVIKWSDVLSMNRGQTSCDMLLQWCRSELRMCEANLDDPALKELTDFLEETLGPQEE